jgi:transketolase
VVCKTTIGKGSPNRAGTAKAHGEPLGAEEIKLTREALGWPHEAFVIPEGGVRRLGRQGRRQGRRASRLERAVCRLQKAAFPDLAAEFTRRMKGELPANFARWRWTPP